MTDAPPPLADTNTQPSLKKRKRHSSSHVLDNLTAEAKQERIGALTKEIQALFEYYREIMAHGLALDAAPGQCGSVNAAIARFLEESDLPFSKLVTEIYAKIKDSSQGLTLASVKSAVLLVGQRVAYGVPNADADILEDNTLTSLWCWEAREMKMLPKSVCGVIKIRRTCRKKIHERVSALSEMLTALQKPDNDQNYKHGLIEASEKLGRVLSEAHIRSLMDSLIQKNHANAAEKETERDQKALVKQLERIKKEQENEKRRMEREVLKEKMKAEKELKRLQEEAEKEERRREKEENEMIKQLRRQQEEAEKDQCRREKEENQLKKQHAIQKQASIMERFLKRGKSNAAVQNEKPSVSLPCISSSKSERMPETVTCLMDRALHSDQTFDPDDILKSHLSSWRKLGRFIRTNREQHWSFRRKPKTELIKELKLTALVARGPVSEDELNIEKLVDGWKERISDSDLCYTSLDRSDPNVKKYNRRRQLLQFDKSYRPAFYGIWPKRSCIIGPRHPLRKDLDLDYDVDSDEEWEEEDPGESLSDCDKDEVESLEGSPKVDEEDESEDGFLVPDGYLSENEGVEIDRMETESRTHSGDEGFESEEFSTFLRQQKYLCTVTDHALRKNQPLVITNLMHEKSAQSNPESLSGNSKLEYMCLQVLCMRVFPGVTSTEISAENMEDDDTDACISNSKNNTTPVIHVIDISDSDLPTVVSIIRSCTQGINKLVETLQQKFPAVSKSQLRNKIREISDFVDNRWQVKKDVLDKLGLSVSPESGRTKTIAAFFSKRCLPPAGKRINAEDISAQPSVRH